MSVAIIFSRQNTMQKGMIWREHETTATGTFVRCAWEHQYGLQLPLFSTWLLQFLESLYVSNCHLINTSVTDTSDDS